jgi:hypothetical protein
MVAVALHRGARLEIVTSSEQRAIETVEPGSFHIVNFGPLLAARAGRTGVALVSVQPHGTGAGPNLVISPLQAEYLAPGEAVKRMPALAEMSSTGLRGLFLSSGATGRFAMTPGVVGRCSLALRAATDGGPLRVTATVGTEVHSGTVSGGGSVLRIGPFSHASAFLSLAVAGRPGSRPAGVYIGEARFVPLSPRA